MEVKNVVSTIDTYLIENLNLVKIKDDKLKKMHNNSYFTDFECKKYLICYSIFTDMDELVNSWEEYQDEDISAYIQLEKYYNNDIKWDVYYILIYIGDESIPAETWLNIEKDKFSCKKVFINSYNKESILEQLNQKLPIVKDYYPKSIANIVDDKYFFERICEELDISKEAIIKQDSDQLKDKSVLIDDILNVLGGDLKNE